MQAAYANSSGQRQCSSLYLHHMFSVYAEDHKFNSSHKTFNRVLNGATLRLFTDGNTVRSFSSPCKVEINITEGKEYPTLISLFSL